MFQITANYSGSGPPHFVRSSALRLSPHLGLSSVSQSGHLADIV
jgi:hypothetical protein